MFWWVTLLIFAASTALNMIFKPKIQGPTASALGDFQAPTAEEGRAVPVVWGTCHVKGPNITWYGDLKSWPIKKWSGLSKQTIGYRYFLGLQMAICHGPLDEVLEIRVDNKIPRGTRVTQGDHLRITWDDSALFGGADREGGVAGDLDVYLGTTGQAANDYLDTHASGPCPAYRGVAHAVARQIYLGNSNTVRPITFVVRRTPNQLGLPGGQENVAGDANPAAMVYELLTDDHWGLGLPASQIDRASLLSAGATLAAEGLGLSMVIDTPASAGDILRDILRHVDGVIYTDPSTGLLRLTLARQDYDRGTLLQLGPANCASCDFSRSSWSETKNTVKVRYVDRAQDYTERVAMTQDLGSVQARGETVTETIDFRGVSNATSAAMIAARCIRTLAYPLAKVRITANRQAWALRPGSVFRLSWPDAVDDVVYRVTLISYGTLTEGAVEIEAVEDIFEVTGDVVAPSGSSWQSPDGVTVSAPRDITAYYADAAGAICVEWDAPAQGRVVAYRVRVGSTYGLSGSTWSVAAPYREVAVTPPDASALVAVADTGRYTVEVAAVGSANTAADILWEV